MVMALNTNNPNVPEILVQIVHIDGPRKGQIDELSGSRISIGRDPSSDVAFPNEARMVSRKHAEIKREGNRFLLVAYGKNGCFVNGEQVEEAYLSQGDVIVFAEGGPKVSFLYSVRPGSQAGSAKPASRPAAPPPQSRAPGRTGAVQPPAGPSALGNQSAPFTIQFGTNIRSYKQSSVKLGKAPSCDFVLSHPRVFDLHAEVFFQQDRYYLRDLTGSQATLVNGRPVKTETPLQDNDVITFAEGGPQLRYLGSGRLAEVLQSSGQPASEHSSSDDANAGDRKDIPGDGQQGIKGLIDSFRKK